MDNLIIGKQPVLEALKSDTAVEKVLILHHTRPESMGKIRSLALRKGVPVVEVDARKLREIAQTDHTQGVVALVSAKAYVEPEDLLAAADRKGEKPLILILDEIEDPQNLGALIRTAECAGIHGVIIPKHHAAPITETVAKASAGAVSHVAIARVTNVVQTIEELKKRGLWIVGSEAEAAKVYYEVDYSGPVGIVVGNEGKGIRRLVKEKCDYLVKIPMYGKIDSLNASVSGALLMYEAVRARHRKPA
ncbi:MAG TPA: 23S rRNA (guanosine(2251)-2'-O)-methyltransferase RlmB [Bacteroidota bacterium]|nr:23S rRNA (guanosine(2251)-2'-O)-methyltransferase RlmB [Bacteroidota bacterium]